MAMSVETKPKTRENIRPPQSGSPQRAINATEPRSAGDEVWLTDFLPLPSAALCCCKSESGAMRSSPDLKKTIRLRRPTSGTQSNCGKGAGDQLRRLGRIKVRR